MNKKLSSLPFLKHIGSDFVPVFAHIFAMHLGARVTRALSGPMRDTPPPVAQYPFEIVSQRGVSHPVCLVFTGYRASIAEILLLWGGGGGIAPPLRMLSKGETPRKGGGGIAPSWPC